MSQVRAPDRRTLLPDAVRRRKIWGEHMKRLALYAAHAIFVGALGYSWLTHGTGVVRNDPARNISIPAKLTVPL